MSTVTKGPAAACLQDFSEELHRLNAEEFKATHGDGFLIHAGIWMPAMAPAAAAVLLKGSANQDLPIKEPVPEPASRVYPVRRKPDAIFSFISVGCTPATDLVVTHGTVGKFHAVFKRDGDAFLLEDSKSQNGTFVNNKRIAAKPTKGTRLKDGDLVRFGSVETIFYGLEGFRALLQSMSEPMRKVG